MSEPVLKEDASRFPPLPGETQEAVEIFERWDGAPFVTRDPRRDPHERGAMRDVCVAGIVCGLHVAEKRLSEAHSTALTEACKPWEHCRGEPPEWESPLMLVWQAACIWTAEQLAHALQVESFEIADGSETLDGDVRGTLLNVVRASMLDVDGQRLEGK